MKIISGLCLGTNVIIFPVSKGTDMFFFIL